MQIFDSFKSTTNQSLEPLNGHSIVIKREDLIHPLFLEISFVSLNIFLRDIESLSNSIVLTFGGAFSNHLAAYAAAGKLANIQTIGIVRGEEWQNKIAASSTLSYCSDQGMKFHCVSRAMYDLKEASEFSRII